MPTSPPDALGRIGGRGRERDGVSDPVDGVELTVVTQALTVAGSAMVVGIMQCATWAELSHHRSGRRCDYAL